MFSSGCKPDFGGVEVCISSCFTSEVEGGRYILAVIIIIIIIIMHIL